MTDRLREPLGVLAGLAILLLLVVFRSDDVCPTSPRYLSAQGSAPTPAPSPLSAEPWERIELTLDDPWTPVFDPTQAGASVAHAVMRPASPPAPEAPARKSKSHSLFSWLRKRRPEPRGNTELERVVEPPAPDHLKRSRRGLQFGFKF